MTCPKCQAAIDDDSRFCKRCGVSVQATTRGSDSSAAGSAEPKITSDSYRDPAMEKEVWEGRPSWRAHYGLWGLLIGGCIAALIMGYRWTQPGSSIRTFVWLLVLAASAGLLVREALIVFGNFYRLTTQRLFWNSGVLTRVTEQVELVRVDDVRICQGVIDRVVNTGDVEIIGSDATDGRLVLESVSSPTEVAEQVRRHVRAARGKGTLFVEQV